MKIFNDKLKELNDPRCNRSVFLDNECYDNIKREVEEVKILRKNNQPLTLKHYWHLKRYEVIKINDTQRHIESGSNIRYYCKMKELFDVLETAHLNTRQKRARGILILSSKIILYRGPYTYSQSERLYCVTSYLTDKLSKLRSFDRK
jgi:hypothetical protein